MPKSPRQKQKLLYVLQYLWEHTDDNHIVSTPQLIAFLEQNGISAERKSIYDDIQTLQNFGVDVIRDGGKRGGYKLASREFELAEVKLLVDLVQSSKFITTKKSRELIKKLESLVSKNDAQGLARQVVVTDRNKAANENIYYSVDVIHQSMAANMKVRYQYFAWDEKKDMKLRKSGEYYEVSPWLLTWEDENYYLVAYDDKAEKMKYYRVDKMLHIKTTDLPREGKEAFEKIDIATLSKKTFGMFAGEERTVTLCGKRDMAGVIIDRFGQDVPLRMVDEETVQARVNVQVSPQFYGWLAGLSGNVWIQTPDDMAEAYKNYLKKILEEIP